MEWSWIAGSGRRNPYSDVQVELTAMVFDRVLPTILTGGIILIAVTAADALFYRDAWLWWLTAVTTVLWIGRIAIVVRFPKDSIATLTVQTAERWELLYGYYTALYICTLSASTLRSLHVTDSVHFIYCSIGTFLFCNAISARMGLRPRLVLLQGGVLLAGLTITLLHQSSIRGRCSVFLLLGYWFTYSEATKAKFDITVEHLRSRRKQRHLAEHDALTGLANRRHFEERLTALCMEKQAFAVFFLDLDGFKKVNDGHGHATGDALLQHVARRLEETVRRSDLTARLGGDEFAVLHTPDATHATASALAARLVEQISAPYRVGSLELHIGTSIGIQLSQSGRNDPDTILHQADLALYAVKQTGKGKFHFAEPDRRRNGDAQDAGAVKLLTASPGYA